MIKFFKTYILPIVEYASIIWMETSIANQNKVEEILHRVKRYSLTIPMRTDHPRYLACIQRIKRCNLVQLRDRRVLHFINTVHKIQNSKMLCDQNKLIYDRTYLPSVVTRRPNVSQLHGIPKKSPLAISLNNVNKYSNLYEASISDELLEKKVINVFQQNYLRI